MYRVKLNVNGHPVVIDANGDPVPNSHVHHVEFPNAPINTQNGDVWGITGPGQAYITVDGKGHKVPLVG